MAWAKLAAVSVLVLVAQGPNLLGQDRPEPGPGSRIRVRTIDGGQRWTKGTVVALETGQLTLRVDPASPPILIDRSQLSRLDVSAGHGRGKAAIGAIVGVALAAALTATSNDPEGLCSGSGCVTMFAISSGVLGATGALVGALVAPERWREVSLPAATVSPTLAKGPFGVTLAAVPGNGASVVVSCRF